jgi:hypothetical protein
MDRRLSLLALLLLAGCGKEAVRIPLDPKRAEFARSYENRDLVILDERWALPPQKPITVGFWGGTAESLTLSMPVKLKDPITSREMCVSDVLEDDLTRRRFPEATSKISNPDERGFIRLIPQNAIEYKPGGVGPAKVLGICGAGIAYCLEPRKPDAPDGWTLASSSVRLVELPLEPDDPGPARGWSMARFRKNSIKWDLKSIDLNPDWRFSIREGDAYDSTYSKWSEKRPSKEGMAYFEMEPLVFAQVMSYTLKETATGKTKTGELLTGWVEGAGKFTRRGPN